MLICFYVYTRLYICNMFSSLRFGGNKESIFLIIITNKRGNTALQSGHSAISLEIF